MTAVSVDTNVIVRFLTRDDEAGYDEAVAFFRSSTVIVASTVIVETEWVLRKTYSYSRAAITAAFEKLFGIPSVDPADAAAFATALGWFRNGLDFADAMHVASSRDTRVFATFDGDLRKLARRHGITPAPLAPSVCAST